MKCKIFNSLDEAINEKPMAAFITNTTNLHIQTAIKLANAKINLFIEKPLSHSFKGISELLKIIKEYEPLVENKADLYRIPFLDKTKQNTYRKKYPPIFYHKVYPNELILVQIPFS